MGSLYGGMFHDAGHEVVMIDTSPEIVAAITASGMEITRADGRIDCYRVAARNAPAPGEIFDLVLFQVKGFATEAAARAVIGAVRPATIILTLQNGLGNAETLHEVFPVNALLIGISIHSCAMTAPGRTLHSGVRLTEIGPASQKDMAAAKAVVSELAKSGFEAIARAEREIRGEIFAKWVLNCGSLPVAALTCLPTTLLSQVQSTADALTREACMLAQLEGFPLDPDERCAFQADLFSTAGGKASMLQDIEAGRRTEIDTVTGAALRLAAKHGVDVPLSRMIYALVAGREIAMGKRQLPSAELQRLPTFT
jgi:2-dehydropantoate 2-reductase